MKIFIIFLCCMMSCGAFGGSGNPVLKLLDENLVLYINFDDGKGKPLLMEGNVSCSPAKKVNFTDRGIFGKAFTGGRISYKLDFKDVDFGRETTFVYWYALMKNTPEVDKRTINHISLYGKGASLLMQRQGWTKSANLISVLAIPRKKGPLARIFGTSSVKKWKVAEWHMVAVSWTAENFAINIDGGKHLNQSPLKGPLPTYYGDKTGKINMLDLAIPFDIVAVDEIMVFNKKLSDNELKELYTQSLKNAGSAQK